VKAYVDPVPLFQRYGAEDQLTAMYDPVVQLKSGGYIVINPTEALVSIDINSGRSTKEHGIEATALNTNIEAAREIARQLRLRDMAGLVVIDFIDMEYGSNVRKVEKAMKDALKNDRARLQIGRISSFGLMEMSRQRLRTGVLEATTRVCPHCDGTGLVRTASSAGLSALRLIEDEAAKGRGSIISLYASTEASIYLLNAKRADLAEIEGRYAVRVEVIPEGENEGAKMRVGSSGPRPEFVPRIEPIVDLYEDDDLPPEDEDFEGEEDGEESRARGGEGDDEGRRKRRKRRRGGRRDQRDEGPAGENVETSETDEDGVEGGDETDAEAHGDEAGEEGEGQRKRRRRGRRRRGGRNRAEGSQDGAGEGEAAAEDSVVEAEAPIAATAEAGDEAEPAEAAEEAPAKPKRTRRKKADAVAEPVAEAAAAPVAEAPAETVSEVAEAEPAAKPKRTRRKKADVTEEAAAEAAPQVAEEEPAAKPKRTRRKKADIDAAVAVPEPVAEPAAAEADVAVAQAPASPAAQAAAEGDAQTAGGEDSDGTPRRGWWQRTFGN
jgi:ribonuclease E